MRREPLLYEVNTVDTSVRMMVLLVVIVGWFTLTSVDTFSYITIHGHPIGGTSLWSWITEFTTNYLILIILIISYLLAEWNIERKFEFSPIPAEYSSIVSNLCETLGLKNAPRVRFLDTQEPYSFAYGRRSKGAKLILSRGITEILDKEELESVILHELSHIKNKDVVFMTWGVTLLQALKYWLLIHVLHIPVSIGRYYFEGNLSKYIGFYIHITVPTVIVMVSVFIVLPFLVVNSISRVREFLADTSTIKFTEAKYLESSLKKIYEALILSKLKRSLVPSRLSIMSISPRSIFPSFISRHTIATHPTIKERFKAIEEKKYIASFQNARKIDQKVAYYGIIAFVISVFALELMLLEELLFESSSTLLFVIAFIVVPLLYIFWVNDRQFFLLVERVSPRAPKHKMVGLLGILAKNFLSTLTLYIIWLIVFTFIMPLDNVAILFWILWGLFFVFTTFVFLVGGLQILFDYLRHRLGQNNEHAQHSSSSNQEIF